MPGGTPPAYADFIAQFPEFARVQPPVVNAQLARAARWVDPAVWRTQATDGMMYLAAHFLALSPFGMSTRLAAKDGTTTYKKQFDEMMVAVTGGFVVAGGPIPCGWPGGF